VTGWAQKGNGGSVSVDSHAFITGPNGVGMIDLGTLNGNFSTANGINNLGQVVGNVGEVSDIYYHNAFITGSDGMDMTNLGTLGGYFSDALSINDAGEAVGWAETAGGDMHAFLYSHGGITNLSLLDVVIADGWKSISSAIDINNNGQIIGNGVNAHGVSEAFLLSYTSDTIFTPSPIFIPSPPPPIPEPETYLMLLSGLGLIGFIAWRRKYNV
jgi:probable HAF family extracellular repeat protein